jgi:hypothetical protein
MQQKKKRSNPPFFINNSQEQLASKEPKMIETLEKRPRKPPMQCWGCGGDHIYQYFSHKGEKVNTIHNVQQVDTMEDMGRNVPRIYATLDKKQTKF